MTFGGGMVISVKDMGDDMLYESPSTRWAQRQSYFCDIFQTDCFSFSAPSKFADMITAFLLPVTEGLFSPLKAPRKSTSELVSKVLFLR